MGDNGFSLLGFLRNASSKAPAKTFTTYYSISSVFEATHLHERYVLTPFTSLSPVI